MLIINGYPDPQGSAKRLSTENITRQHVMRTIEGQNVQQSDVYINWKRIAIPRLRLAHAAHLLFIQGISPSQFFLAASLNYKKKGKDTALYGPLVFIAGTLSPPFESEACWTNLVLGQLMKSSSDKTSVADTILTMTAHEARRRKMRGA